MLRRTVGRHVAHQGETARQYEMGQHRHGAAQDRLERRCLRPPLRRQPDTGQRAGQQQVIMAGPFAQHPAGAEDPLGLGQQQRRPGGGGLAQAQGEAQQVKPAPIVEQMVGRMVLAEIFQPGGDDRGMGRQHRQRVLGRAGQPVPPGEGQQIDGAFRRRIGMPGPGLVGRGEPLAPLPPHRPHPAGIVSAFQQRHPGEAVQSQLGLGIVEPPRHQRRLVARLDLQGGAGQAHRQPPPGRSFRLGREDHRGGFRRQPGPVRPQRRRPMGRESRLARGQAQGAQQQPAPQNRICCQLSSFANQGSQHENACSRDQGRRL